MKLNAGGPTRTVPWTTLSSLIVALLLGSYLVVSAGGASAAVGDCTITRNGSSNVISWEASGRTDVIRRNGDWLATPPRGTSTYTDTNAPDTANYIIRIRDGVTPTDFVCTAGGGNAPSPTPVAAPGVGECFVTRSGNDNVISWGDGGGVHVLRVNGNWLSTPGSGSSTFTHVGGAAGASYQLITYTSSRAETTCISGAAPTTPAPNPGGPRQFVVQVSMDGLRSDFVNGVITPNLAQLINGGASTLNARTDPQNTQTLPNHASQFTGRFVTGDAAGNGGTGVLFNVDAGNTIHDTAGEYVSSIWDVVHDNGGRTVLYNGKEKFDFYDRSWNSAGAPDTTGADDGPVKIDVYRRGNPFVEVDNFINDLTAGSGDTFGLYHIREPDTAGHTHTWGSPGYVDGVSNADGILGELLDALDAAGIRDSTTIIITADHGGPFGGLLHNTPTDAGAFIVPFIVNGPEVAAGTDLYALNQGTRQDPGNAQVGPSGPQPIRGHDMANLALDILGLPPVPGSAVNNNQDLAVN